MKYTEEKLFRHLTVYAGTPDDFEGNYLDTLMYFKDNPRYTNDIFYKKFEQDFEYKVKRYITGSLPSNQPTLEERIKYATTPPVEITKEERVKMITDGVRFDKHKHENPNNFHSNCKTAIEFLLNNQDLKPESNEAITDIATSHTHSLKMEFRKSLCIYDNIYKLSDKQKEIVQNTYVSEVTEMMALTRDNPEIQEIYAKELVDNWGNFQTKELRQTAMNTVQAMCPNSELAEIAKKKEDSPFTKIEDFLENVNSIAKGIISGKPLREIFSMKGKVSDAEFEPEETRQTNTKVKFTDNTKKDKKELDSINASKVPDNDYQQHNSVTFKGVLKSTLKTAIKIPAMLHEAYERKVERYSGNKNIQRKFRQNATMGIVGGVATLVGHMALAATAGLPLTPLIILGAGVATALTGAARQDKLDKKVRANPSLRMPLK